MRRRKLATPIQYRLPVPDAHSIRTDCLYGRVAANTHTQLSIVGVEDRSFFAYWNNLLRTFGWQEGRAKAGSCVVCKQGCICEHVQRIIVPGLGSV